MRIPTSTYRLQLNANCPFDVAREAVPYLDKLGITDLYSSPIYTAQKGSGHGYDVVAHENVSPELGGEAKFVALAEALRARGMGLLLDIVPNHMCIALGENWRWTDVLENGPSSASARFFDIDWHPPKPELIGRVLLPFLPDQLGRVLISAGFELVHDELGFGVRYGGARLPLAPRSWTKILDPTLAVMRERASEFDSDVLELESVVRAITRLPARLESAADRLRERQHEVPIIKRRLSALNAKSHAFREALSSVLLRLRGRKGEAATFDDLAALLVDQPFRLSSWRVAAHEINYRRFFDINELAAIRVEDPAVFEAVHALPFRLAKEGLVTGLRIDHVDGLYDPAAYLVDVRNGWTTAAPHLDEPYVVVEKILGRGERLSTSWKTAGTTGYEFMNQVVGLFIDVPHVSLYTRTEGMGGATLVFADIVYECKKLMLKSSLAAELAVLARRLDRISEQDMFTRDFTRIGLEEALGEVVACFPVYRTYIGSDGNIDDSDRDVIESALARAHRRSPLMPDSVFDFIRSVLLLEEPTGIGGAHHAERLEFIMKFQQLTGPVMAKGVEDTAFYRYFPLAALDEVGGHPESLGVSLSQFHREMTARQATFPHALSATDTHDAKRSEDARARLAVLSELPREWRDAVALFRKLNRQHKTQVADQSFPDEDDEYLFYQTVIGVWPPEADAPPDDMVSRIADYMSKAVHEAKRHSSWINPNERYDEAVAGFVASTLHPVRGRPFLEALSTFRRRIERPGLWNSLTQTVLKIAAPGVPDFYQGTELWSFHLVDPDNRRPIDFSSRDLLLRGLLDDFESDPRALADRLLDKPADGRIKLLVTSLSLELRRRAAPLFRDGAYLPLETVGERSSQVIAFARQQQSTSAIVVCGRYFTKLGANASKPVGRAWGDANVRLPESLDRHYRDIFTGRTLAAREGTRGAEAKSLPVAEVLAHLPVALLIGVS